jgi:hypothetical protein
MRRITVDNYRSDRYYQRVVRAVGDILEYRDVVTPVDVFIALGLLDAEAVARWRNGHIEFLERAIRCNLSVASRILRILRLHAHDLNLRPSSTVYRGRSHHGRAVLHFTKTGERNLEAAYARHFVRVQSKRRQQPPNSALEPSAPMRT